MDGERHPKRITVGALVAIMVLSGLTPLIFAQGGSTPLTPSVASLQSKEVGKQGQAAPSLPPQSHGPDGSSMAAPTTPRVQLPGWGNLSVAPAGGPQGTDAIAAALQSLGSTSPTATRLQTPLPVSAEAQTSFVSSVLSGSTATGDGANSVPHRSTALVPAMIDGSASVPQWKDLCDSCLPAPRDAASMAYDPADGYVVLFGGEQIPSGTTMGSPLSDTWTYKNSVWTELTPTPSPPPREDASFVYDTIDGKLLLFGGENLGGSVSSPGPSVVLQDTWTFKGGTWTQLSPTTPPPARFGAPAVYDTMDGYVVLFGGYTYTNSGTLSLYDDLWSFKGTAWTQLPMQAGSALVGVPAGYRAESMVYDSYDGYTLLYGGAGTWYYLGGYWYEVTTSSEPPVPSFTCTYDVPTCIEGMAYDAMDRYVVYQTTSNSFPEQELTWVYRAGNWLNVTPSTAPSMRVNPSMTYNPLAGSLLFFGGADPADMNDAWVYPGPLTVTVSTNRSSLDVNQIVNVIATPSGGYPPYTYTWTTPANLGCPSSTSSSMTCQPSSSAGSPYTVSATVTDSAGIISTAVTTSLKVFADPTAPAPSPTRSTVDVGVPVTFTENPAGGAGGYSYAWSGLPQGCTTSNTSALLCTPSKQTVNEIDVVATVTDADRFSVASPPLPYMVYGTPVVTLVATPVKLDAQETVTLWANATGGTSVYTYAYSGLPAGCTSANVTPLRCQPTATGNFVASAYANDTGGGHATPSSASFIVYPDPQITSNWFVWGASEAYANESLWDQINYTGGIQPFTACFFGQGPIVTSAGGGGTACKSGVGGTNIAFASYWYTSAGVFPAEWSLNDSTRWNVTLHFNETVVYPPMVSPPSITAIHEGTRANASFSLYNLHGAPPMEWWLNDSTLGNTLCGPIPTSTYGVQQCNFIPTWNGTDKLNLTVQDALHARLFVTFTYSVPPSLGSLNLKASTGTNSVGPGGTLPDEAGSQTSFSAAWKGGNGAYTCMLSENGTGTLATKGSSTPSCAFNYTWAHPATYTVTLTVTDSLGGTGGSVTQSLFVDVIARTAILSFTPSATTVDAQASDNLSVTYTGGYPSYTFSWNFGNGATRTTALPWVVYAWPQTGTFTATVTITDSLGVTSSPATASVTVGVPPAVKNIDVNDGPVSVTGIGSGGSVAIPVGTNATFNL